MIDDLDLFSQGAAAPSPTKTIGARRPVDLGKLIHDAFKATSNRDHLPDTIDAFRRLPESIRPAVEKVADRIYQNAFIAVYERAHAGDGGLKAAGNSPTVMNHSAKLAAMSAVGGLSFEPWHIADAPTLKRIAAALEDAETLQPAAEIMSDVKGVNLFIAATESDDRDSYLKAARGLMKRHQVRQLLLDAELVEWRPQADFKDACEAIGILPLHVGIADRAHAPSHSIMATGHMTGVPSIFIDTKGRRLQPGPDGGLAQVEPEVAPTRPTPNAAGPSPTTPTAPAPRASGVAPPSSLLSRIEAAKSNQVRRRAP